MNLKTHYITSPQILRHTTLYTPISSLKTHYTLHTTPQTQILRHTTLYTTTFIYTSQILRHTTKTTTFIYYGSILLIDQKTKGVKTK